MGIFTTVWVSDEIELPHFPEELGRGDYSWQSKRGLDVYNGPYLITSDGRLEMKQQSYRDKTEEEKQEEAEKWGFDSWKGYVKAYEEADINEEGMVPDAVDGEVTFDDGTDNPPTITPREKTLADEWWGDQCFHGTFEFHQAIKEDPIEYEEIADLDGEPVTDENGEPATRPSEYALNVFIEYEARFDKGDLTDIVFMGERHGNDDPIGAALDKIEEWREWKEEQKT